MIWNRPFLSLSLAVVLAFCLSITAMNLGDFKYFYAAASVLRNGGNPYSVDGFYSPLIVLLYFVPLSLLPLDIAFRLNAFLCLLAYIFAFWKFSNGSVIRFWLMLITPFAVFSAWYGNIEWMPLLAGVINPFLGIWLAIAKPQIGIILSGVLLLEISRTKGFVSAALVLVVVAMIFTVSLAAGMRWASTGALVWNISIYPYGIVPGLILAVVSARRLDRRIALAAAPLLSPYLNPASWVGLLPILVRRKWLLLAVPASWALLLYWRSRI